MNPLANLFSGPENIFWFVAGFLSVQVWQWIKCKWKDYFDPEGAPHRMKRINWFYVWTSLVLIAIVGVGIQNQTTYTFAERLAKSVSDCQIEFNTALVANRELNSEDRKLMVAWQQATFDRAQQLTYLQQTYGPADDEYLRLKGRVDAEYFKDISQIEADRVKNEAERSKVPYPEPTCGRKK